MPFDLAALQALTQNSSQQTWAFIKEQCLDIAIAKSTQPLSIEEAAHQVRQREREIGKFDDFLSSIGWELWFSFEQNMPHTAERLIAWWAESDAAKAILILDGLSLREMPWLIEGAKTHGFTLKTCTAYASELPSDTNSFAKALGFARRSQLENNGGNAKGKFSNASTESMNLPWEDCAALVKNQPQPHWFFWHHWPDTELHHLVEQRQGKGLDDLTQQAAKQLTSPAFWAFVTHLAQGRQLVITSDHGYAATGTFADEKEEVGNFLKKTFAAQRYTKVASHKASDKQSGETQQNGLYGPFVPPVALALTTAHGTYSLALGRRKWKCQGGYPTLTHGGLSLLETLSPFIELEKR